MSDIVTYMEENRVVPILQDVHTLYLHGMRLIQDDQLFYEEIENQQPIKFIIDFNQYPLKSE